LYLVLNIAELRLYTEENGLNRKWPVTQDRDGLADANT
jgi:hypothetical protein